MATNLNEAICGAAAEEAIALPSLNLGFATTRQSLGITYHDYGHLGNKEDSVVMVSGPDFSNEDGVLTVSGNSEPEPNFPGCYKAILAGDDYGRSSNEENANLKQPPTRGCTGRLSTWTLSSLPPPISHVIASGDMGRDRDVRLEWDSLPKTFFCFQ